MYRIDWKIILLSIIIIHVGIGIFGRVLLFNEDFFYGYFLDSFTEVQIDQFQYFKSNFGWLGLTFHILVILIKISYSALSILIGVILAGVDFSFKGVFRTVMMAEIVFVFSQVTYIINIYLNIDSISIYTIANYFPVSMLSFLGSENVVSWLHYPLQTLNLFEVFYVILISWLLSKQWKPDFVESLNIVIPSYGIGLLLWMALVVFLTLQIS